MTDLTEQWDKGELPNGYYYCKLIINNMKPSIERCKAHCIPMGVSADRGEEVLAPVPSYEGFMTLVRAYDEVVDENTKLKELLKECKGSIATLLSKRITEVNGIKQKELLTKINQALGEDK